MEVELQDGMSVLREVGAELETKYMEKIRSQGQRMRRGEGI